MRVALGVLRMGKAKLQALVAMLALSETVHVLEATFKHNLCMAIIEICESGAQPMARNPLVPNVALLLRQERVLMVWDWFMIEYQCLSFENANINLLVQLICLPRNLDLEQ